jgi:hypothetical protein
LPLFLLKKRRALHPGKRPDPNLTVMKAALEALDCHPDSGDIAVVKSKSLAIHQQ